MLKSFLTGLDVLIEEQASVLGGRRVGLLTHPAALTLRGEHAAGALRAAGANITALLGPEHGYYGAGGAGEAIGDERHRAWHIAIYSLYKEQRRPSAAMLQDVDILLVDLQDLAVRCYTYVTTLRYVLEAAAEFHKPVIVCDRPVPFPDVVDGPVTEPAFESFVGGVPAPFVYGMTPGETAQWLKAELRLDLELSVIAMRGYKRDAAKPARLHWISPSPAIRTWETAWCYPTTVAFEALPSVDYGRGTTLPFQVVTAPWLDAETFCATLNKQRLTGIRFEPVWNPKPGARLVVTRAAALRPVTAAVAILHTLQKSHGPEILWQAQGAREEFFDKLFGTDKVRLALKAGTNWKEIAASWKASLDAFHETRKPHLIYPPR